MKYLKKFNNVRFEVEDGSSIKIRMYDGDTKVGYSVVRVMDDLFDKWNLNHDDIEVSPISNAKSLYIIGISMENKGSGYGSSLVKYIENFAKKQGCEYVTLSSLTDALGFWKKVGYEVYSLPPGYYSMYKKL